MNLYQDRSFRFCFTNQQMAEAVLDFVDTQPELQATGTPPTLINVTWKDDPYSTDLAEQFRVALTRRIKGEPNHIAEELPHSIGGLIQPKRT